MINSRVTNQVVRVGVRNATPHIRNSNFQGGVRTDGAVHQMGTPLGLLLTLTYSVEVKDTPTFFSDSRPNIRITSN